MADIFRRAQLIIVLLAGTISAAAQPQSDGTRSYEQFEQAIVKYPYLAPTERAAKVTAGVAQLTRCMDKATIQQLLGSPDYGEVDFGPKGPSERWLGSHWMYYLSKLDGNANTNNLTVEIFFDTRDRAHWIVPAHILNAKEIGRPNEPCK